LGVSHAALAKKPNNLALTLLGQRRHPYHQIHWRSQCSAKIAKSHTDHTCRLRLYPHDSTPSRRNV